MDVLKKRERLAETSSQRAERIRLNVTAVATVVVLTAWLVGLIAGGSSDRPTSVTTKEVPPETTLPISPFSDTEKNTPKCDSSISADSSRQGNYFSKKSILGDSSPE